MRLIITIIGIFLFSNLYSQKGEISSKVSLEYLHSYTTDKSVAIEIISKLGIIDKNYVWERDTVEILGSDFNSLSSVAKDIVGVYCAKDINTLIAYYMGLGMSQSNATMYYLERRIVDIQNAGVGYCERVNQPKLQAYILIFLGENQALTFNDAVRNFKSDLCSVALVGSVYGDTQDGIMDYIESTGSYSSGGLKSYTMSDAMVAVYGSQDNARLALVSVLKDIIINGK